MRVDELNWVPMPMKAMAEHFNVNLRAWWIDAPDLIFRGAKTCLHCRQFDGCLKNLDHIEKFVIGCPNVDRMRILSTLSEFTH